MLTLSSVAILCGMRSLFAIAQFGRDYGPTFARTLGFRRGRTPCCTTLHYLFRALDEKAFERVIAQWLQGERAGRGTTVAVDGKTLRGTQSGALPGVHLLAAYAEEVGSAVAQLRVPGHTNEHKTALRLLNVLPLKDAVVTGDAAFCQKDLSREVLQKGGHYVWAVKDNQPGLKEEIAAALADDALSPSGAPARRRRATARRAVR
jgi:predicted transposase YbfD/YdcC